MQRLGLSLSGGGFRATMFHLGVVQFLRDAGILSKITHITAVSGGSILGAHLALNWDKYTGSPEEFDKVAEQLIRFVRLDVRNRIVRRFPYTTAINMGRRMLRLPRSRRLTRAGLLEQHYERFLFGDTALSRLPEHPQLHILATNLSEGCLGSFNRNGLLLQRRVPGRRDRFDRVHLGLTTVPMAVAASSAFPGFSPPLELTGWDVDASGRGETQAISLGRSRLVLPFQFRQVCQYLRFAGHARKRKQIISQVRFVGLRFVHKLINRLGVSRKRQT